jgi:alkanesulfonate monooxygenase SsuD/methylene tetrahydromethanopterin reductase-like flavin-dependent oxidoreductase (luciferase family)
MKIEVSLSSFDASWEQIVDAAGHVDALGIGGLWVMDHLTGMVHERSHVLECFALLSGLAATTTDCRLGTLVVNVSLRNPALLAQSAATVQLQSNGRFVLGLGAGGGKGTNYATEMSLIGLADQSDAVRRTRVSETIEVVEHLWSGGDEPYVGQEVQIGSTEGFLHPKPPPQLLVAGSGPKMAELAGRRADGFNTTADHPELKVLLETVRSAALDAGRVPPECSVYAVAEPAWLDPSSPQRQAVAAASVETLILILAPPFDADTLKAIAAS